MLTWESVELPEYDAPVSYEGKEVGRVTSAARDGDGIVALAYVRAEVPADAEFEVGAARAGPLD